MGVMMSNSNSNPTLWIQKENVTQKVLRYSFCYVAILIISVCVSFLLFPSTGARIGILFTLLACGLFINLVFVKFTSLRRNERYSENNTPSAIIIVGMTMVSMDVHPTSDHFPSIHVTGSRPRRKEKEEMPLVFDDPPAYIPPPSYNEIEVTSTDIKSPSHQILSS